MFILAKYGDGQCSLFNPDCMVVNLVRHMKEKCGYPEETGLDLVDQNGETRGLSRYPPRTNAAKLFNDRNVYILVNIERAPDGSYRDVVPLIEGGAEAVPELHKKMTDHLQQLEMQRLEEVKRENERREKERERQRALELIEEERHHKKKVSMASPESLAVEKSTHKKTPEKSRPTSRMSLEGKGTSKVNISRGRGRKH
ncbi:uncharacterized protein CXorf65-like [Branchiostoma lanceolatum]|uniref:uncharacterized protein CXorf65-like n=1 Tax=Branchiostoma lanceolatum TaxID=7740 RepID=UPI0034537F1F